jgi:hypothetical protein
MKTLTIASKLGHYQADLTQTPEGVEIKFWACYQDGGPRRWMGTDMVDAPWHLVTSKVYDTIWGMVPEITRGDTGVARRM